METPLVGKPTVRTTRGWGGLKNKKEKTLKTILKGISILALTAMLAQAGDDKDLKKIIEDQGIYVETAQKGVVLSGYVDTSYTYQFASKGVGTSVGNGQTSESAFRAFDRDNNDFNINAFKLALEKPLPAENKLAAGFRADLIFGEDAKLLAARDTATSFDDLALEQAYVQFRVPVGNGLDFKFGKFVSLNGYEVIESPANLNFSRGLLWTHSGPWMNTGVLASYKWNDTVDTQFGVVNGPWNSSDSYTGFSAQNDIAKTIVGRVNVTAPGKNANLANTIYYTPQGQTSGNATGTSFTENETVFLWDMWGNWAPKFADDKLLLGFNSVLGFAEDAVSNGGSVASDTCTWTGIALYTKYQFTKMFSLAGRLEWLHADNALKFGYLNGIRGNNSSMFTQAAPGADMDVYSWTLTAGFNIWENLLTRLEYRYDWSTDTYVNGQDQHQIALNLVYTF
jgi:hypothetical protein